MKKSGWIGITAAALVLVISGGALAVGNYIYTSATVVPCAINDDDLANKPEEFYVPGSGNGPFPGPGWEKWVGHDISEWWMVGVPYEPVMIPVAEGVELSAWWITPIEGNGKTVIVTHGFGTSRRDYNTLLPAGMLVKSGFNVLLVDSRDTGESTCVDGLQLRRCCPVVSQSAGCSPSFAWHDGRFWRCCRYKHASGEDRPSLCLCNGVHNL